MDGKLLKPAENEHIPATIPRNLATLVVWQFSKCPHLIPCNPNLRYSEKNIVSVLKIMINWGKMLKNRRKSWNPPNSAKIQRAKLCKCFYWIASTPKPYPRKNNFEFISHRKKVSWAICSAWPPSWILGPGGPRRHQRECYPPNLEKVSIVYNDPKIKIREGFL